MITSWANAIAILIVAIVSEGKDNECVPSRGLDSIVCICNATYCDSTSRNVPEKGFYRIYESGKSGKRMSSKLGRFEETESTWMNEDETITVTLQPDERFQEILGFGGAFTDAASENIQSLNIEARQLLLESYFGQDGSRYNLGHVPIGGSDFSREHYTYADTRDDHLKNFNLHYEDYCLKIPVMQKALAMNPELLFTAATVYVPEWMKTEHDEYHAGFLKEEYYQTYADYLVKFLHAYGEKGLKIWAISPGREPIDLGDKTPYKNTMSWSAESVAHWIANNLGPSIAASRSNDTIILVGDDTRHLVPDHVTEIFNNLEAADYAAGIAIHGDVDYLTSPQLLDRLHGYYPDKFIIITGNSVGNLPWDVPKVSKGDWGRGEMYILGIIENLNHWATGYIDSNLVLDQRGGPNHAGHNCDAAIIVDHMKNEFYKQPIYYAMAHFSKFIPRGSVRIGTITSDDLEHVAFLTPDKECVLVVYNGKPEDKLVAVEDPAEGTILTNVPPYSIQTIIYKT